MESSIRSVPGTFPKETDVTHVHVSTEEHIGVPVTYVVSDDYACLRKPIYLVCDYIQQKDKAMYLVLQ